jgi:hypothetical protein
LTRLSQPKIAQHAAQLGEQPGQPRNRDEEISPEAEGLLPSNQNHRQPKPPLLAPAKSAAEEGLPLKTRVQLTLTPGRALANDSDGRAEISGDAKRSPEEPSHGPDVAGADDSGFGLKVAVMGRQLDDSQTPIDRESQRHLDLAGGSQPESTALMERTLEASRTAGQGIQPWSGFSQNRPFDFHSLDLNHVVERNVREFLATTKGNIEYSCRYGANLPRVLADGGMLDQMICRLIVNALDAMPEGGRITLTTERLLMTPSGLSSRLAGHLDKVACLSINDTGCGIVPANLSRIFEPCFTTKDPGERSGMGLAIIQEIVKQHRGWIEVDTQAGCGTTFKILLPGITTPTGLGGDEPRGLSQRTIHVVAGPQPHAHGSSKRDSSTGNGAFTVHENRIGLPIFSGAND